ncbi:ribonuclease P protein component [Nocardioides dilutus]
MLPAAHRLTEPAAFSITVRAGRRAGSRTVVAHLHTDGMSQAPPRVGLVVSKAVGNAVVRNRVKRRLRHQVAPLLSTLPPGTTVVLRALPPAAASTSAELAEELRAALSRCLPRTMVTS